MHTMIRLVPWDDVLYEEGLSANQLRRLIDQGLFPTAIVVPVSARISKRYFPSHELEARRALLLSEHGDEMSLKALLCKLYEERPNRASNALSIAIGGLATGCQEDA